MCQVQDPEFSGQSQCRGRTMSLFVSTQIIDMQECFLKLLGDMFTSPVWDNVSYLKVPRSRLQSRNFLISKKIIGKTTFHFLSYLFFQVIYFRRYIHVNISLFFLHYCIEIHEVGVLVYGFALSCLQVFCVSEILPLIFFDENINYKSDCANLMFNPVLIFFGNARSLDTQ